MFLELLVAAGAFYFYKHKRKNAGAIEWPWSKSPITRADAVGAAGERQAQAKLRETPNWLCGNNYYLHEGPLIIEHAPGTDFPTAEIDHLAVTPFGIFVFETKNWSGHISPSSTPGMLTRTERNGKAEDRRSPLEQNRTKVAFFRSRLPPMWPVAGAGLFPSTEANLAPYLHSDLVSLDDLPQWFRTRRDVFGAKPAVDIPRAVAAVRMYADSSTAAVAAHKQRVR